MRILILILAATAIAVGTINTPPAANTDGRNQVAGVAANKALVRPERPASLVALYEVTAYCGGACCCQKYADGITASGKPVTANGGRFCAADRSIPFGTMIDIPGYGRVPVLDRGGAIKAGKLDLFFADDPGKPGSGHRKALQWGRRTLNVTIY